jgi:hypothetical protein
MDADEARAVTDVIRGHVEAAWELIVQAYTRRAWAALGYQSWDGYCIAEFGTSRLRLPREERPEMVTSLRHAGLSIRAIASATGLGVGTVHREIEAGVPDGTPETDAEPIDAEAVELGDPAPITGTDGKSYPEKKARKQSVTIVRDPAPEPETTHITLVQPPADERPARHDTAISARIAAQTARRDAATVLSFARQAHIRAAMNGTDLEDLCTTITAALADVRASLEHLGAVDES